MMKVLGLITLISVVNGGAIIPSFYSTPTYNSVVHSARINNGFGYNTVQSHAAYVPAQPTVYYYYTYPTYTYDFAYPGSVIPSYPGPVIPSYPGSVNPSYPGSVVPSFPGVGANPYPGSRPGQPPIEVSDPADGTQNDGIQQGSNNYNPSNDDDDTVTIESA